MHAASKGHATVVGVLLATGINSLLLDKIGRVALHCAAWGATAPVVAMLTNADAQAACSRDRYISDTTRSGIIRILLLPLHTQI